MGDTGSGRGFRAWFVRQRFDKPVWTATFLAIAVTYATGLYAFNRYVPALRGHVLEVTVVRTTDSDYFRCGRDSEPEQVVTFRTVDPVERPRTFRDQKCVWDVRRGDRLTVAREDDGKVTIDPITSFTGVLGYAVPRGAVAWLLALGAQLLSTWEEKRQPTPAPATAREEVPPDA